MQVRLAFAAVLIVGLQVAAAAPASADDAPVLVADSDKVSLTATDNGEATATVTLENQGTSNVRVTVAKGAGAADGCVITPPEGPALKRHRQQKIAFTFSAACKPDRKEGTNFIVSAGEAKFPLHANPPAKADPNWVAVGIVYLLVAGGAALLLIANYWCWTKPRTPERAKQLGRPLPGLAASWKFSDSWAANATVVTALFTGIFGAKEVVTALLGDGATNLIAVALVSAAISVGLAGVSPMVLQSCRTRVPDPAATNPAAPVPAGLYVTPLGLLLAAWLTLTATGGQLGTILYALMAADFWSDGVIWSIGAVAAALLSWYGWTATTQNLTTGAKVPPEEPDGEAEMTIQPRSGGGGPSFAGPEPKVVKVVVQPAAPARSKPAGIL